MRLTHCASADMSSAAWLAGGGAVPGIGCSFRFDMDFSGAEGRGHSIYVAGRIPTSQLLRIRAWATLRLFARSVSVVTVLYLTAFAKQRVGFVEFQDCLLLFR